MIRIKRKTFSDKKERVIGGTTSAVLGAGAGYGITKLATPKNLEKLANKIEWKKAKVLKSEKLGKALRSRKGKAAIIGTTALGFGLVGSRNK